MSIGYASRGPLLRPGSPEAARPLIVEIGRIAKRLRAILLRASPDVRSGEQTTLAPLARLGFHPVQDDFTTWNTPRVSQTLDLRPSEELLWQAVRRRFREYVRAAPRRGVVVAPEDDERALDGLYDWEYIRRARAEGCEVADFGPSGVQLQPRETDPGYGVYRFKQGFGCATVTYAPFQDLVFRPALYRLFRLGERGALPLLWRLRVKGDQACAHLARALVCGTRS